MRSGWSIVPALAQGASLPTSLQVMDGRYFSGTRVEAFIADGSEKFKKTKEKRTAVADDDDEDEAENQRLDQFGSWLEEDG